MAVSFLSLTMCVGCANRDLDSGGPPDGLDEEIRTHANPMEGAESLLGLLDGRWEAADDLGTIHRIDIRLPSVIWIVGEQTVRHEWCSFSERREERVWLRCVEVDPAREATALPPSLAAPDTTDVAVTERGFELAAPDHLRMVPLVELAWQRTWIEPVVTGGEGERGSVPAEVR